MTVRRSGEEKKLKSDQVDKRIIGKKKSVIKGSCGGDNSDLERVGKGKREIYIVSKRVTQVCMM